MTHDPASERLRPLADLRPLLDDLVAEEPPEALVEDTLRCACAALRESACEPPRWRNIPAGFRRELLRLIAATLPALAVAIAWDALILARAPGLLAAWLPVPLAWALPIAYVLGAAGWLALVLGSLPLLAHHRALTLSREATP